LPVARNHQIAIVYVIAVVAHMHAVELVIYVAVFAHPAVVPVDAAVTVRMVETILGLMDLKAPWTGNIQCFY